MEETVRGVNDACCSAHGYSMDLRDYLVEDGNMVKDMQWDYMEEPYYDGVLEYDVGGSLTDAVMKLWF